MDCCKTGMPALLAIVIIVFALWETAYSQWVVIIAAAIILVKAVLLESCVCPVSKMAETPKAKAKKKN